MLSDVEMLLMQQHIKEAIDREPEMAQSSMDALIDAFQWLVGVDTSIARDHPELLRKLSREFSNKLALTLSTPTDPPN